MSSLALSNASNYVSPYFWNTHAQLHGWAFWENTVDRLCADNFVLSEQNRHGPNSEVLNLLSNPHVKSTRKTS